MTEDEFFARLSAEDPEEEKDWRDLARRENEYRTVAVDYPEG